MYGSGTEQCTGLNHMEQCTGLNHMEQCTGLNYMEQCTGLKNHMEQCTGVKNMIYKSGVGLAMAGMFYLVTIFEVKR